MAALKEVVFIKRGGGLNGDRGENPGLNGESGDLGLDGDRGDFNE